MSYIKDSKGKSTTQLQIEAREKYKELQVRANAIIAVNEDVLADLRKAKQEYISKLDKYQAELDIISLKYKQVNNDHASAERNTAPDAKKMREYWELISALNKRKMELQGMISHTDTLLTRTYDSIDQSLDAIARAEKVKKVAKAAFTAESEGAVIVGGCNEIIGKLSDGVNRIADSVKGFWKSVKDGVRTRITHTEELFDAITSEISDFKKSAIEGTKADFADMRKAIRQKDSELKGKFAEWGEKMKEITGKVLHSAPVRIAMAPIDFAAGSALIFGKKIGAFAKEATETGRSFRETGTSPAIEDERDDR